MDAGCVWVITRNRVITEPRTWAAWPAVVPFCGGVQILGGLGKRIGLSLAGLRCFAGLARAGGGTG
jgi:hypothetical protein